ncbi:MAG: hypothetical protein LBR73_04645 [Oscillospiraceae bacterium]|nr:hypothetical protein [Oscillospiraceae bacterium]
MKHYTNRSYIAIIIFAVSCVTVLGIQSIRPTNAKYVQGETNLGNSFVILNSNCWKYSPSGKVETDYGKTTNTTGTISPAKAGKYGFILVGGSGGNSFQRNTSSGGMTGGEGGWTKGTITLTATQSVNFVIGMGAQHALGVDGYRWGAYPYGGKAQEDGAGGGGCSLLSTATIADAGGHNEFFRYNDSGSIHDIGWDGMFSYAGGGGGAGAPARSNTTKGAGAGGGGANGVTDALNGPGTAGGYMFTNNGSVTNSGVTGYAQQTANQGTQGGAGGENGPGNGGVSGTSGRSGYAGRDSWGGYSADDNSGPSPHNVSGNQPTWAGGGGGGYYGGGGGGQGDNWDGHGGGGSSRNQTKLSMAALSAVNQGVLYGSDIRNTPEAWSGNTWAKNGALYFMWFGTSAAYTSYS